MREYDGIICFGGCLSILQLAAVNMAISSEIKFQRLAANLFRAEHDEVQNYITFNVLESVLRIRIRFIS